MLLVRGIFCLFCVVTHHKSRLLHRTLCWECFLLGFSQSRCRGVFGYKAPAQRGEEGLCHQLQVTAGQCPCPGDTEKCHPGGKSRAGFAQE